MGVFSALSKATGWLFSREEVEPDIVSKGITLMSVFKEHGERTDALVEQMKAAAARRDHHAQEAVTAEAERTDLERQFVEEEMAQNASYKEVMDFVASLAPLPRLVTDTDAAIKEAAERAAEEARLKAEAEAKAESDRIAAEEAAAAEAQRLADEEAARVAAEQAAAADPVVPDPAAEPAPDAPAEPATGEVPPAA